MARQTSRHTKAMSTKRGISRGRSPHPPSECSDYPELSEPYIINRFDVFPTFHLSRTLEKDQQRSKDTNMLNNALKTLAHNLSDTASTEKRAAVEDLFWLIQEYRVSVYAQELRTSVPVSLKKLKKMIKHIERMV